MKTVVDRLQLQFSFFLYFILWYFISDIVFLLHCMKDWWGITIIIISCSFNWIDWFASRDRYIHTIFQNLQRMLCIQYSACPIRHYADPITEVKYPQNKCAHSLFIHPASIELSLLLKPWSDYAILNIRQVATPSYLHVIFDNVFWYRILAYSY